MSNLTAGNWIAYQSKSQKQHTTNEQWTIAIEHRYPTCHGVGPDGAFLFFSGICTEADAKAMAASKELLELAYQYQSDLRHPPTSDSVERRLERIAAVLAKAGAK